MDNYDVKRFALVLAVQAEIDGMKVLNSERDGLDYALAYSEVDFCNKAEELRNIAFCHNDQL